MNGTSPLPLPDVMDFRFGHAGVTSSSLTSLSFIVIEGSVDCLDCLADLFPLNSRFGHSSKLELLEDFNASFNKILITEGHISVSNGRLVISRAQRRVASSCRLLHLTTARELYTRMLAHMCIY